MNKGLPTLSVLLANYNHGAYVSGTLTALLEQDVPPTEIIVVDDASTDDSLDRIAEISRNDARVRLLRNDDNKGVVPSYQRALANAKCEFVYLAAADDRVLPGLFGRSLEIIAQHPTAAFCCSDPGRLIAETGSIRKDPFGVSDEPVYLSPDTAARAMAQRGFFIAAHTCIVRRSAMVDYGPFQTELRWHYDWFLLTVLALQHGVCYVPDCMALLRIVDRSYSRSAYDFKQETEVLDHVVRLLRTDYRDVLPRFRRSGALAFPLLWYFPATTVPRLLMRGGYKECVSPLLVLRRLTRAKVRAMAPAAIRRSYSGLRRAFTSKRHGERNRVVR